MISVPDPVRETLARAYGAASTDLIYFGGGRGESDGIVYSYPTSGGSRLLKILAIPLENQQRGLFCLDERMRFMRYLGENGAQVAYPLLSPQDVLYESCQAGEHLWVAYSMEIAPGRNPSERAWSPAFFRRWGQAIGQMHRLAQNYPSWRASILPESGEAILTWQEEWQSFYDWCQDAQVRNQWMILRQRLEGLPVRRDSFGFIHNDPHVYNILAEGERLTVLDFDVANHHWFVNDIAIACQHILFLHTGGLDRPIRDRSRLYEFLGHFMEGYQRENSLDVAWLDCLDLFIAYRRILMFTVMFGWLKKRRKQLAGWKEMILAEPPVAGEWAQSLLK